ncbi:helix-turn-helix domain-containing protein [Cellulomonas taurus]|uniref:helix-turn-helix domain-containing protein n=1 Tax=Cellulomonas taurus TaxID=2729175 RepID=UPI00145F5F69|nr:helix-turn-helix transcriptional regulator [Cellulomonas taurus]
MPPLEDTGRVHCRLDELLAERGMTLARLSELVGVTVVNLSVLKNDRAKAIRFSTLTAICDVLGCQIGDLLVVTPRPGSGPTP